MCCRTFAPTRFLPWDPRQIIRAVAFEGWQIQRAILQHICHPRGSLTRNESRGAADNNLLGLVSCIAGDMPAAEPGDDNDDWHDCEDVDTEYYEPEGSDNEHGSDEALEDELAHDGDLNTRWLHTTTFATKPTPSARSPINVLPGVRVNASLYRGVMNGFFHPWLLQRGKSSGKSFKCISKFDGKG